MPDGRSSPVDEQSEPFVVDFPTLGWLAAEWIKAHCKIADGWSMGEPFVHRGWQLWCTLGHYRVRLNAVFDVERPVGAPAFAHRRSLIVGPQKAGKSPWAASIVTFEAVGPCIFAGWADGGEVYRCVEHGCGCGWTYLYRRGDAMGIPRPMSKIQLLATAEDQTDNVYLPLQEMIRRGPLADIMRVREDFIRLPDGGEISPITASPNSKLGAPIHFALADESGLYTGKLAKVWRTMRRGLAGMSGRGLEVTNPWDPMENSTAQQTFESRSADIFRFYRKPPAGLDFAKKGDRGRILEYVYHGSPWVDLDAVEAEAGELMGTNPAEAKRFYGNMLVQGLGSFLPEGMIERTAAPEVDVPDGTAICLGFDGSRSGDWTALRAETIDGHRFTPTYGPDERPTHWDPKLWPGERIPRGEVDAALDELTRRYAVARIYMDPRHWETQAEAYAALYGDDVVIQWPTNQISRMHEALVRYVEDADEAMTTHDDNPDFADHAARARKVAKPGDRYILGKPAEHLKIDILMADVLAHEAAADMRAVGWGAAPQHLVFGL